MRLLLISCLFIIGALCHETKVSVLDSKYDGGNEEEWVSIDLKKKDGSEDIKLIVQMRIHLFNGMVHLNNNSLEHGVVSHVHMRLFLIVVENGIKRDPELKHVQLRVLVSEKKDVNGNKNFVVEEEFVEIEGLNFIQVTVHQVILESATGKPIVTKISLLESEVHHQPAEADHHVTFRDSYPHLPPHGLEPYDKCDYRGHRHDHEHHHHHHHHHHHGFKCWYHRLSWKAKLALFSMGFLSFVTFVLLCSMCIRRRNRRQALQIMAPINDTVAVDIEEEKKVKNDSKLEFHFEFENSPIVVDDKKQLID